MNEPFALHVGLNAHLLSRQATYRSAGIHHYIWQLVRHLPAADAHLRLTIFADHQPPHLPGASDGLHWQLSRWSTEKPWKRILWEQAAQPWVVRRAGVHLLHSMAFVSPLLSPAPTVVTVHDLSFLRFPERFPALKRLYLTAMTRLSCRRARRIIAVSQATADETVRWLGVPPSRIDIAPHGVDHQRFRPLPPDQVTRFRQARGLPERLALFVGTLEPRKNLPTLVEAFGRTRARSQGAWLVIAGGRGWHYQTLYRRIRELALTESVHLAGFVPNGELALWYNAATMFVYPSIYEGFGMPLLEAMACGTPVISSNVSAMPQVVGEAGLLVAPDDIEGLAEAMDHLFDDADLRADLGRRGQARAAAYTWDATAQATVASYRRALE